MHTLYKVGEKIQGGDKPQQYELLLTNYVYRIEPKSYGIEYKTIDPHDYFITSGDAVEKTKVLKEHYDELYTIARSENICCKVFKELAENCQRMLDDLLIVRGTAIFLETEWDNHVLLCIPKNPRNAKE